MEFKDYYEILGVKSDADAKEIKTAYRKLARRYHPDMNSEAGAEAKFKEVAEAYQVLKNDNLRAEFDEVCQYGTRTNKGFQPPPEWSTSHNSANQGSAAFDGDFSEFFNSVFGGQRQGNAQSGFGQTRSMRGQDVEIELPVFLEETLTEFPKTVEYTLPSDPGSQIKPLKKHLKVKIPQGVQDGAKIRVAGQGKPGSRGGAAGDLYLHIRIVPHPLFEVSGHNLLITLPLAPWEAALGTKVTVPTLDGKISLTVPANTTSGKKFKIKGKGLKSKSIVGDLLAIVQVVLPSETSEKSALLWQQLADSEHFDPRKEWSK